MSANPRYRNTNTRRYKIFNKGMKVLNDLYGYTMYEEDGVVDQDGLLKNSRRRYKEINKRFGGVSDN